MSNLINALAHYLLFLLLFALLGSEHILLNRPLPPARARRLVFIDIAYGSSASLLLFSAAAWLFWSGNGLDYYLHNGLFHAKVGLFLLVGVLSTLPTFVFLNWRNALQAGQVPDVSPRQRQWLTLCLRLELLLLLIIPLLAMLMARGYGAIGQ